LILITPTPWTLQETQHPSAT